MKLKDWADKVGVKYLTAYRWYKAGTLPVNAYQTQSGTILVQDEDDIFTLPETEEVSNNAMSLFLKKTVEFSKNNSTVEDFAGYVLSNFQLKLSGQDQPKYSRNKPKPEEIQKHFKKFITSNVKPAPCAFIPEPEVWENITDNFVGTNDAVINDTAQGLVNEIRDNDEGVLVSSSTINESFTLDDVKDLQIISNLTGTSADADFFVESQATTGIDKTYVDFKPQNYTYSANSNSSSLLGSSLGESQVFINLYNALHTPGPNLNEKPKRGRPRKIIK